MTELEQMKAMLRRAGVNFSEPFAVSRRWEPETEHEIVIEADDGPANVGYGGFVSKMGFTAEGALLWVGAWE